MYEEAAAEEPGKPAHLSPAPAPFDARAEIAAWEADAAKTAFAVEEDGAFVGASSRSSGAGPARPRRRYWVRRSARGRGIATAALRQLSEYARRELGLARLWLEMPPDNAASLRVAEKAGYTREGTPRPDGWVVFFLLP